VRKILKILAGLFLVLLFLAGATLTVLFLRGDLHRYAQQALTRVMSENLDARFELGRCSGSLLHTLQFESVRLFHAADTLAQIDTLRCHWRPLSLLWGQITLDQIEVSGLHLSLHQLSDGSWNYQHYLRPAADSSHSQWSLRLKALRMRATLLSLRSAAGTFAPQEVVIPSLAASARLTPGGWQVELSEARLNLAAFGLAIPLLQARLRGDARRTDLASLRLHTADSRLEGKLHVRLGAAPMFSARLSLDSLAAADVALLSGWRPPFDKARIEMEAAGPPDSITVNLHADAAVGSLRLQGWIKPAGAAAGRLEIAALRTEDLLDLPGALSARMEFSGTRFSATRGRWQASGSLEHTRLSRLGLERLPFSATLAESLLTLTVASSGAPGEWMATAGIHFGNQARYDIRLATAGLDLAPLTGRPRLASSLNLNLHLAGESLNPDSTRARLQLNAHPSRCAGFAIDSLAASGEIRPSGVRLDTIRLAAPGLRAAGAGRWSWPGPLALTCTLQLTNHSVLAPLLGADSLHLNGTLQGRLSGTPDSLALHATARLRDSHVNKLAFREITAALDAGQGSRLQAALGWSSVAISAGALHLADSLDLHATLAGPKLAVASHLVFRDSLRADLALKGEQQDSLWQLLLTRMDLQERRRLWQLEAPLPRITLQPTGLTLSGLSLVQGEQRLELAGKLDVADSLAFRLDLENLDLATLAPLVPRMPGINGALTWRADLRGVASQPRIVSTLRIEEIRFAGLPAATLQVSGRLENTKLAWDGALTQGTENSASFSGRVPLHLRWPLPERLIEDDDPVDLAIRTRNLQAGLLATFLPGFNLKGTFSGDLAIGKSWGDPQPAGYLELRGGSFSAPYLGKPYKPVAARFELAPAQILLKQLQISSGEGQLSGEGSWRFTLDHSRLTFHEMQLRLKADHFSAADSPELSLLLDGELTLTDQLAHPKLNGALRVERARIDLAAFTETPSTLFQADLPLLMVARGDTTRQSYDRKILLPTWLPVVERSRGSIKLEIPRNTWLRTPEMNIEISGDLDLAKEGEDFGLFGAIQIVRGNYDLFSRRFDIEAGTLTFTGGDNLPEMSLTAQHLFRSQDKVKHTLGFTATGELRKPLFSFTLDEATITESDAVSYLAFGRSFGDLTHGERNNLMQSQLQMSGDAFKQLLAGQIAGEVTRSLQQKLDLDVIEFRGDQNWRQSTVVVGKYLTNNLFLSYERQLNLGRTNEVAPEQMTLEYEILRALFLQATRGDEKNTGFDLIYKWEK